MVFLDEAILQKNITPSVNLSNFPKSRFTQLFCIFRRKHSISAKEGATAIYTSLHLLKYALTAGLQENRGRNSLTPEPPGIYSAVMSRMMQGGPRLRPCRCPGVRSQRPMGIFSAVFAGMLFVLFAASAENDSVRVRCDESGIIIRAEGEDFVILAPRRDEHFQAEVLVQPLGDWELVRPTTNPFNMKGGDAQGYEAKLEPEDERSGTIFFHNYCVRSDWGDGEKDVVVPASPQEQRSSLPPSKMESLHRATGRSTAFSWKRIKHRIPSMLQYLNPGFCLSARFRPPMKV